MQFTGNNDVHEYSPLALAYIGDAVHNLFIRGKLLALGNRPVHQLHEMTARYVRASAQCKTYHALEPELTEEEIAVFKRGRNAKSVTVPKNADVTEYRHATGFEALLGYLYLKGDTQRLNELLERSFALE